MWALSRHEKTLHFTQTKVTLLSLAGSRVQLAGKESQIQGLPERVLSMTGSADGNSQAASMILDLLSQDASGKYDHMSTNYRAYAHSAFQAPVSILQHQHEQVAAGGYQFGSPQHSPQPLARNLQAMALQGMASQQHAGVLPALAREHYTLIL